MGLRSVQPYAPQRVLRQLGRYQVVPEDEELSVQVIELHPEAPLPEALIQQIWNECRYLKEDTQAQVAEGENRQLTRKNEELRAQLQNVRIATETPVRSKRDEKIINNLRMKAHDYAADLIKIEKDLLDAQTKLAKGAEEQAYYLRQKYGKEITILKEKLFALGNEMLQQKTEKEHCYALIRQLEESVQQLQDQNNTSAQVLEARAQQIGRLLQEKRVIRTRNKEINDYVVMKCHECEDMTRSMFFASMMTFVH
ncbi:uncharacterized protein [Nicotiana tomentosiformis]|uniref:uncharacterized protein n=1 Tax=Nicotiana tomentosiformis TaxID=4098 RepID=UPI00388C82E5